MKRIILKININGSIELFTSLEKMFLVYPDLRTKKSSIDNYLSRKKEDYIYTDSIANYLSVKKEDYVNPDCIIRRCIVNELCN